MLYEFLLNPQALRALRQIAKLLNQYLEVDRYKYLFLGNKKPLLINYTSLFFINSSAGWFL